MQSVHISGAFLVNAVTANTPPEQATEPSEGGDFDVYFAGADDLTGDLLLGESPKSEIAQDASEHLGGGEPEKMQVWANGARGGQTDLPSTANEAESTLLTVNPGEQMVRPDSRTDSLMAAPDQKQIFDLGGVYLGDGLPENTSYNSFEYMTPQAGNTVNTGLKGGVIPETQQVETGSTITPVVKHSSGKPLPKAILTPEHLADKPIPKPVMSVAQLQQSERPSVPVMARNTFLGVSAPKTAPDGDVKSSVTKPEGGQMNVSLSKVQGPRHPGEGASPRSGKAEMPRDAGRPIIGLTSGLSRAAKMVIKASAEDAVIANTQRDFGGIHTQLRAGSETRAAKPEPTGTPGNQAQAGISKEVGFTAAPEIAKARTDKPSLIPAGHDGRRQVSDRVGWANRAAESFATRPVEPEMQDVHKPPTNANAAHSATPNKTSVGGGLAVRAEPSSQVFELAPSEHFVTPFSELGTQIGSFKAAETMVVRPEAARMVASQMAEALLNVQSNKVEISLNPEELGRVRMVLSASEQGVIVAIVAERQETLDLMRRHIDQLAKEFRELGYENIGFEFGDRDPQGGTDDDRSEFGANSNSNSDGRRETVDPVPMQTARATASRGLDLRL